MNFEMILLNHILKNNLKYYLDAIVASRDSAILHLDIGRRMSKLALVVGPGALVSLELSTDFQLEPPRVLLIDKIAHI